MNLLDEIETIFLSSEDPVVLLGGLKKRRREPITVLYINLPEITKKASGNFSTPVFNNLIPDNDSEYLKVLSSHPAAATS